MSNARILFATTLCVLGFSSIALALCPVGRTPADQSQSRTPSHETSLRPAPAKASTQSGNLTISTTVATAFESRSIEGVFVIRRNGSTLHSLQVRLQITGSATNGVDYQNIPEVVQIPAGSASIEVRVRPIDDTEPEADEIVTIGLVGAAITSESTNTLASLILKDNDTLVQVETQASGSEANSQPVVFRFTRAGNLRALLTVNFAVTGTSGFGGSSPSITDGSLNTIMVPGPSATSGVDFNPPPVSITFQIGETSKTLSITPIDDSIREPLEVVDLRILPSVLYTIGPSSTATGTIEDNDTEVQILAQSPRATEAGRLPAIFSFTRLGDSTRPLTINYRIESVATNLSTIADGSSNTIVVGESGSNTGAVSGTDFVAPPSTLTFQAGETTKQLEIVPIDDAIPEGPESFRIAILPSVLYRLGRPSNALATIEDNDQPVAQVPVVSIQATVSDANEAGPINGLVTFNRTGSTATPLTIQFTINGPGSGGQLATNGVDFEQLPNQVVIPAGASSTSVTIRPIVDDVSEPQEKVIFQIAPSTQYSIQAGGGHATVKIKDNHPGGRP